ncbi:HAD-IA family hydrolase [Micromonospora sp. WMMC241]|uniref:HAD family hydrolase n=1 Tax=Micromonospora sp. WMMC241 TaxID=3015159 RepID=UPI0022B67360|nr:HAD-IA family hydrolase [Micromonospora sp. WMMC241]MCZ7437427.1 HAD-IA family hydrolase [Micromonospora sp. WMMC241]
MIRAVIVDVDDTLCLTQAASLALENEVLTEMGRQPVPREVHLSTWGEPLLDAMPRRSPGVDLSLFSALHRRALERHIADGRLDVIPPENLRALDEFVLAGRSVFLLTSRTEDEMRHMLEPDHVLAGRVSGIYHAGNTRFRKPDPRVFDELLTAAGIPPRQCVYVGDSPGDAVAAGRAGMSFVGCLQSKVRKPEDFHLLYVNVFVDAFPDVVEAIRQLDRLTAADV